MDRLLEHLREVPVSVHYLGLFYPSLCELSMFQYFAKIWNLHAKRYNRQIMGRMRRSSFRTSRLSSGELLNAIRVLGLELCKRKSSESVTMGSSVDKQNEFEGDTSTFSEESLPVMLYSTTDWDTSVTQDE